MELLLDTYLLLWAGVGGLPAKAAEYIGDDTNDLYFSAASMWEIAIKANLGRADFRVDAEEFYRELLRNGYLEVPISGRHGLAAGALPQLHRDPFDRILVAQAACEGLTLLTADSQVAAYSAEIRKV
ncbi:MAG: type II toxin-antitoxin system VapC family toxin [Propionibacteriaceae bacterium]|jgi:PIN domain nuclease of toxin-antitoxin system|nr:type II toxin-antitoxin system VapC family toxin [Propionibacteriaceae bacterium]